MTSFKFILLRAYCLTLGRLECCSRLLRRVLVWVLISGKKKKYVASSRFFDPRELLP